MVSKSKSARPAKPQQKKQIPRQPMKLMRQPVPRQGADPTQAAAAYGRKMRQGAPEIMGKFGQCRIIWRELVTSVTGSVAFTVQNTLALNPGMAASFPWLSGQAQGWELYRFNKLCYRYLTKTSTAVPGSMLMVPDYDAADAAPSSEQQAADNQDSVENSPWNEILLELDPERLHELGSRRYVRTGALAANQDIKTYDSGNVFLCTIDGTAVGWGKVWVEYDVTFYAPQNDVLGRAVGQSAKIVSGGVISRTAPFGTTQTITGGALVTATGGTMTFGAVGSYVLLMDLAGTVIANVFPTVTGTATSSGGFTSGQNLYSPTAATTGYVAISVLVSAIGQTAIIDFTGSATTITGVTSRVAVYPQSLL